MPDYTVATPDDLEFFYHGLFGRARAALGVESFGLATVELGPDADNHPDHAHDGGQEEVYVVLKGTGTLEVDGESVALEPGTMVRVGPGAKRKINPGGEGMRLLAIGGTPGEAYEAPAYTELGAADPLDG